MDDAIKTTVEQLIPLPWFDIWVWIGAGCVLSFFKPTKIFGIPILLLSAGGLLFSAAVVLFREISKATGPAVPAMVALLAVIAIISIAKEKAKFWLILASVIVAIALFFGIPLAYGG